MLELLKSYPAVGALAPIAATVSSFLNWLDPIFSAIGLMLAIIIAAITALIKYEEWQTKRVDRAIRAKEYKIKLHRRIRAAKIESDEE